MSAHWATISRLLYNQKPSARDMRLFFGDSASADENSIFWLDAIPDVYDSLFADWDRGVAKRTSDLSKSMFQAVAFRDSRDSLQLGLSMWRLSWITFIFLPLTFTVGIFGMSKSYRQPPTRSKLTALDVDLFESNPPIKWWFVTSAVILAGSIVLWYAVKHSLPSYRKSTLRRGGYQTLYEQFTQQYPRLWTRNGPCEHMMPQNSWRSMKWTLVKRWFDRRKVAQLKPYNPAKGSFGIVSLAKQELASRWLSQIDASAV